MWRRAFRGPGHPEMGANLSGSNASGPTSFQIYVQLPTKLFEKNFDRTPNNKTPGNPGETGEPNEASRDT